ncbi:MAG: cytochrome c biogenesis CcdA family protein [Pseudorhodoplanes sp.]|uniref:cytochrome c biogenesis CcdA family protein n=1 Tax=Pseudorhodoplanes sp. TaxID=1934341 RepID=UPI003D0C9707
MTGIGLALLAGLLSVLSPCVLPLIPIVIGAATGEHRFGPAALAAGLAVSFVTIGLFVATIGFSIGLDLDLFRMVAALLLIAVGGALLIPRLQMQLAAAAGPVGSWMQTQAGEIPGRGLGKQFTVGLLLGAVWSPCVGPTLGAASLLAARAENLGLVALTMFAFGIGAALPLLLIGMMSREALARCRGRMLAAGNSGKVIMGAILVATGVLILAGLDKRLETILVDASPAWLTSITTRF